jgi:hypothetical protein
MFKKIMSWFKKAEVEVATVVPTAPAFLKQMLSTLESNVMSAGETLLPIVIGAIKAAATNPGLSLAQKLASVIYTVEQTVPGVASSVINATVHTAYTTLAQDPTVPEVINDTLPAPVPAAPVAPALIIPPAIAAVIAPATAPVVAPVIAALPVVAPVIIPTAS